MYGVTCKHITPNGISTLRWHGTDRVAGIEILDGMVNTLIGEMLRDAAPKNAQGYLMYKDWYK